MTDIPPDLILNDLSARLARLEFHLTGLTSTAGITAASEKQTSGSIAARLVELQRGLQNVLKRAGGGGKEILGLYERFPELFATTAAPTKPAEPTLSLEEQLSTILAAAPQFQTVSSQLSALSDLPIPLPQKSAQLSTLLPRIERCETRAQALEAEIAVLRKRSARLLERWYLASVEGENERVAEWDERVGMADRRIMRLIRAKEREEKEWLNKLKSGYIGDHGDESEEMESETDGEGREREPEFES